jgi:hypothetical protein
MKLEDNITRELYTRRGGGVEIDLTNYGHEGERMSAYQNYLGGDMLGGIANDCTIADWDSDMELLELAFELKILYCQRMGLDASNFLSNKTIPISAY